MKTTKIACVYHSIDLDGWMSAAIANLKNEKTRFCSVCELSLPETWAGSTPCCGGITTLNIIDFIGYNYGQPIPDLSEYDKVIMCDISFPKEHMEVLFTKLQENFIWCDHHISAIKDSETMFYHKAKGLRDTKFAACELTWQYFFPNEPMPEIVRLLGRYDCFGHKQTDEEQKVLEFQYGARESITDVKSAYDILCITKDETLYMGGQYFDNYINQIYDAGKAIYRYLCTDAKQAYKNGFTVKLVENVGMDNGPIRKFICINKERFNPINFGIDYNADGYDGAMCWHLGTDKMVNISFYNDNGQIDCSAIAKSFGGGGHKGAAGCRMTLEQFQKLIS